MTLTLETLTRKLKVGPPSLGALAALFIDGETMQAFEELLREYLPDRKQFILRAGTPEQMVQTFCDCFVEVYFPINEDSVMVDEGVECLYNLVRYCPVDLYGYDPEYMEWGDVLAGRLGIRLMRCCIRSPEGEDGLPYIEEAVKARGQIARRLPAAGLDHEDLMEMCRDTPWQALAEYAEWVHCDTGISLLDNCWSQGWEPPEWNKADVLMWKEEFPKMQARWDREHKLAELLEADRTAFGRMVEFLLEKSKTIPVETKLPKTTLVEVFSDADEEPEGEEARGLPTDL